MQKLISFSLEFKIFLFKFFILESKFGIVVGLSGYLSIKITIFFTDLLKFNWTIIVNYSLKFDNLIVMVLFIKDIIVWIH